MPSLIDWYLVELKLRIARSLPDARVEEILKEAEAHLRESVQHRISGAVLEAAASEAAIEAYGKPEVVALGYVRGTPQRLWGANPMCWTAVSALIAVFCWNFHWLTLDTYFDNFGETWQNYLAGFVGLVAFGVVVAAARAGLRSYRVPLIGTTLIAAGLSIPIISAWMIPAPRFGAGISRFHLGRDLPKVRQMVGRLDDNVAYVQRGISEYGAANSEAALSADLRNPARAAREFGMETLSPALVGSKSYHGGAFVVPREYGAFASVDGGLLSLETMARFEDAKKAWSATGPKVLSQVEAERTNFEALLRKRNEAEQGRLFFFDPKLYSETVIGTLMLLPAFLLLDLIGAATARPRRRWPIRALA